MGQGFIEQGVAKGHQRGNDTNSQTRTTLQDKRKTAGQIETSRPGLIFALKLS